MQPHQPTNGELVLELPAPDGSDSRGVQVPVAVVALHDRAHVEIELAQVQLAADRVGAGGGALMEG